MFLSVLAETGLFKNVKKIKKKKKEKSLWTYVKVEILKFTIDCCLSKRLFLYTHKGLHRAEHLSILETKQPDLSGADISPVLPKDSSWVVSSASPPSITYFLKKIKMDAIFFKKLIGNVFYSSFLCNSVRTNLP